MLEGAIDGVIYYLEPQWHRLSEPRVWADAAVQVGDMIRQMRRYIHKIDCTNCFSGLESDSNKVNNRYRALGHPGPPWAPQGKNPGNNCYPC
jgi:hypothetical protein